MAGTTHRGQIFFISPLLASYLCAAFARLTPAHQQERTAYAHASRTRTALVRPHHKGQTMDKANFFEDLQQKLGKLIENSPARDLDRNMKAMLTQGFSKLDLVTREEFDIQAQVLARTRAKLEALEQRVAELEAQLRQP
jgi:BMFP domain-containing protein YqiC